MMNNSTDKYLTISIDNIEIALPINIVDRVSLSQLINPLTIEHPIVKGFTNIMGNEIVVISLRSKLKLPEKELDITDHFVVIKHKSHFYAIISDKCGEIITIDSSQIKQVDQIVPGMCKMEIYNSNKKMLYIYDPLSFFSSDELNNLNSIILDIETA